MTEREEIQARLREYMSIDPDADEMVMLGQKTRETREERRKRAADLVLDSPAPQLFGKIEQFNSPSGFGPESGPILNQPKDDTPAGDRVRSLLNMPGLKRGSDL